VRPLQKRIAKRYEKILVKTKVAKLEALAQGLRASYEGPDSAEPSSLITCGRGGPLRQRQRAQCRPRAGVEVSARVSSTVDRQMRTNVTHYFCDWATSSARRCWRQSFPSGQGRGGGCGGHKASFDARCIPAVAIPILKLHGRVSPKPRRRARYPVRQGRVSLGRQRAIAGTEIADDGSPSCCSTLRLTAFSRPASLALAPAT